MKTFDLMDPKAVNHVFLVWCLVRVDGKMMKGNVIQNEGDKCNIGNNLNIYMEVWDVSFYISVVKKAGSDQQWTMALRGNYIST